MRVLINGYPITTRFLELDEVHKTPHRGVDYGLPMGTPVESIGNGTVTSLTDEGSTSFGKAVHLHLDNGTDVIYGHLSKFTCRVGQHVNAGDIVGMSGSTGGSTGPHLHVQVSQAGHVIDPTPIVAAASSTTSFADKLNPLKGLEDKIDILNQKINTFMYWANPLHWFEYLGEQVSTWINSDAFDWSICAALMIGIGLWMFGMNWHKKYMFWMFISYLVIRGAFS